MGSWPHTGRSAAVLLSFTLIGKSEKYYYFRFLPDENNNIWNRGKHSVVFLDFEISHGVIQSFLTTVRTHSLRYRCPNDRRFRTSRYSNFSTHFLLTIIVESITTSLRKPTPTYYEYACPITQSVRYNVSFQRGRILFFVFRKTFGAHTFNGFRRTPNCFVGRRFLSTTIVFVCFAWSVDV